MVYEKLVIKEEWRSLISNSESDSQLCVRTRFSTFELRTNVILNVSR